MRHDDTDTSKTSGGTAFFGGGKLSTEGSESVVWKGKEGDVETVGGKTVIGKG